MLFDINVQENRNVVEFSSTDGNWTFSITDLNNHSAAWVINQITNRGDAEIL